MPYEFKVQRRVEFSETDMAGIMHYSNFFRFMETAEHAFYRSLGHSVVMKEVDPPLGWPRGHDLEIPQGPVRSFEAPGGQRLAIYELTRPGVIESFAGRRDF
jgi:hypothetical protein